MAERQRRHRRPRVAVLVVCSTPFLWVAVGAPWLWATRPPTVDGMSPSLSTALHIAGWCIAVFLWSGAAIGLAVHATVLVDWLRGGPPPGSRVVPRQTADDEPEPAGVSRP